MAFALLPEEVARIRAEEIAKGNFPEVMETPEAAIMVRRSEAFLEASNAPRSLVSGEGEGKRRRPIWLKSQLLAWLRNNLTYDAEKPLRRTG